MASISSKKTKTEEMKQAAMAPVAREAEAIGSDKPLGPEDANYKMPWMRMAEGRDRSDERH